MLRVQAIKQLDGMRTQRVMGLRLLIPIAMQRVEIPLPQVTLATQKEMALKPYLPTHMQKVEKL